MCSAPADALVRTHVMAPRRACCEPPIAPFISVPTVLTVLRIWTPGLTLSVAVQMALQCGLPCFSKRGFFGQLMRRRPRVQDVCKECPGAIYSCTRQRGTRRLYSDAGPMASAHPHPQS